MRLGIGERAPEMLEDPLMVVRGQLGPVLREEGGRQVVPFRGRGNLAEHPERRPVQGRGTGVPAAWVGSHALEVLPQASGRPVIIGGGRPTVSTAD